MRVVGAALVCITVLYGLDAYFYAASTSLPWNAKFPTFIGVGSPPMTAPAFRTQPTLKSK
jgi:hypothetical protein